MTMNEPRFPLRELDPAHRDPGYWHRLKRSILAAAAPELARRRAMEELTVSAVLLSWSRTVVPAALLAAALAGLLLLRQPVAPGPSPAAVDELLVGELPEEPFPVLFQEGGGGGVTFASLGSF